MKCGSKLLVLLGVSALIYSPMFAQTSGQDTSKKQPQVPASDPLPRSDSDEHTVPPLGDNESSSKQNQIDISPPKDDTTKHPQSDVSDVTEMHTWNPMKAQKDVEVGEFYMKRGNYRAAEGRFREALTFKPGDAMATYRLAEVLDAQNNYSEAAKEYQEYLKIPSSGKYSSEAKKALARLQEKNLAEKP